MPSFRLGLLLCTAPMLLVHPAQAQSNSCELLKQQLASRIPPEIRGYAMDDVPARTPVPPGGKVIGTCEGGARKVVYRRFGGPPLTADGAAASSPAPAVAAASAPVPAPVVPPRDAPKPKAETAAPPPAKPPAPTATSARTVAPAPALASAPALAAPQPAASPRPAPVPAAAPVAPVTQVLVDKPSPASTPAVAPPLVAPSSPEPVEPAAAVMPPTSETADETRGFFAAYGRWLWLLLAVPLGALVWSWVSHRMAYDSAGLPRGPRL